MIDLGLTKIALIGAVALVVIGPERLPAVARMAGTLFGRAQRYISNVKAEVNREMQMEELRKMQDNIVSSANDLNKSVADDIAEAEQDFSKAIAEANQAFVGVHEGLRVPSEGEIAAKQRDFRKKKLTQNSSLPMWFKRKTGRRTRVISAAARVVRYRPGRSKPARFFN
ncbi:MAG: twin-arginine translocase subunit TatB [Pseudomonadota bacterium]|jgi:sec-independent protein translocase protein TatB